MKKVAGVIGMMSMVLFFNLNPSLGQEAFCPSITEPTGAVSTYCDNGDGTTTVTVNSSYHSPGACIGPANGCEYSYVA